ncbi:hypothetical protein QJS10_CPB04g01419 [Acorus calamus]|uniref:Uncharacterized protein n=1 Tax=Acorus calamus TaxID=4465 RepID=A0AAV9F282_ACOCL|nr:hypothetical protein QJS10_CPB04g01419 [Acorus calamus]
MTLEEYEKLLLEKRKALDALKTEERRVALDKEFEMMQLVEKKKEEEIFIKLSEKDKLKKKESTEKDEKVRKAMSINEFLKPKDGERYYRGRWRGGRGGRGQGRGFRGEFSRRFDGRLSASDFPVLGEAKKE